MKLEMELLLTHSVGVQKLAALNSNTATRHILDGSLYIYRSLAEALTYRGRHTRVC